MDIPKDLKCTIMEEVYSVDAQEAVYSIKTGWPDCRIKNVYMMINDCWEDEDVE